MVNIVYGVTMFLFGLLSALISAYLYFVYVHYFLEWEVFYYWGTSFVILFYLDWMSLLFGGSVALISGAVFVYSVYYMEGDLMMSEFIMLVCMFVFSMFLLISSPNMFSILLGWDGLGLSSYCLVIYYQNISSSGAGMLTILMNRLGDLFLLLSIVWLMDFGYLDLGWLTSDFSMVSLTLVLYLVAMASMTSSAQFPFSSWLPAAMSAPTPVSSLVHSSTLVTAGVYLLIRFNNMGEINHYLMLIAMLTLLLSGSSAVFELDFKKIIALSTLSQLSLMLLVLSLGALELAFYHLLAHAMFSSLLFLCAGVYIHTTAASQGAHVVGSSSNGMVLVSLCFSTSLICLCGAPFLSGFYSKDLLMEYYFMSELNIFVLLMLLFGVLLTLLYSYRLYLLTLVVSSSALCLPLVAESLILSASLIILWVLSIVMGAVLFWLVSPALSVFLGGLMSNLYFLLSLLAFVLLGYNYLFTEKISQMGLNSSKLLGMEFISVLPSLIMVWLGSVNHDFVDQGWINMWGGHMLKFAYVSKNVVLDQLISFSALNSLSGVLLAFIFLLVSFTW